MPTERLIQSIQTKYKSIRWRSAIIVLNILSLSGCVSTFEEQHFFQTVKEIRGERIPTNYYRLKVNGWAAFSSARYVSGYYDERAVDLFFDEIQLKKTDASSADGAPNTRSLFRGSNLTTTENGAKTTIEPLSPDADNGAFVMVLSSNASAVTGAIGQFAENQVVADAITNLANRDLIAQSQGLVGTPKFEVEQAASASQQIDGLMELLPDVTNDVDQAETERSLLRVLTAIGRLKGSKNGFDSFDEAQEYFGDL